MTMGGFFLITFHELMMDHDVPEKTAQKWWAIRPLKVRWGWRWWIHWPIHDRRVWKNSQSPQLDRKVGWIEFSKEPTTAVHLVFVQFLSKSINVSIPIIITDWTLIFLNRHVFLGHVVPVTDLRRSMLNTHYEWVLGFFFTLNEAKLKKWESIHV